MEDTDATGKVAEATEKVDFVKSMDRVFQDSATLEVLDTYRSLGERESDRVYRFVVDAKSRESDPKAERAYLALESFWLFVGWYQSGDSMDETCFYQELTEDQYDRYLRAWQTIQAVNEEVEKKMEGRNV